MLATSVLGDETSETFSRELFRITGGNPFLVHEMLGAARTGASGAERLDGRDLERLVPPRIVLANFAPSRPSNATNHHPGSQTSAQQALSQGWLTGAGSVQLVDAVTALIWIDRIEAAERACDAAVETAGRTGSASLTILAHALRSQLNLRRGLVADAAADARIYSELMLADAPAPGTAYAEAHLADALLEHAELEEAGRVLADPHPRERVNENPFYLFSRGSHRW